MSATPLTDAYLASRCNGQNEQSWVEFAKGLELKMRASEEQAMMAGVQNTALRLQLRDTLRDMTALLNKDRPAVPPMYFTKMEVNGKEFIPPSARLAFGKWQPIATAPKRGVDVLTWDGKHVRVAFRGTDDDTDESLAELPMWSHWYEWDYVSHVPSHWMPLPDKPTPQSETP